MGLDARLNVIYGYRLKNTPIEDYLNNVLKDDGTKADDLHNPDDNNFMVLSDQMCGDYEYVGIFLYQHSSDYGEDNHIGFNTAELINSTNDEILDKSIQEKLPFLLNDHYDVAGLMDGELPKIWIVKNVW